MNVPKNTFTPAFDALPPRLILPHPPMLPRLLSAALSLACAAAAASPAPEAAEATPADELRPLFDFDDPGQLQDTWSAMGPLEAALADTAALDAPPPAGVAGRCLKLKSQAGGIVPSTNSAAASRSPSITTGRPSP